MLAPFFRLAMAAPGRQTAFRRAAIGHLLFVAAAAYVLHTSTTYKTQQTVGYGLVGAGIVQGAILIGWRLAQLPKSQALEFLLVSPVRPRRLFLAEALVGLGRFTLVQLAGLPILLTPLLEGSLQVGDVVLLIGLPYVWGAMAGLGLTVWAYETRTVKRIGEVISGLGILVYLTVGVLAGERLKQWVDELPGGLADLTIQSVRTLNAYNPFGVVQFWFDPFHAAPMVAVDRAIIVTAIGLFACVLFLARGMSRLKGHFHDRHYRPITDTRLAQTERIGERPLSWWAVRRVMEYSGRVNIWLAGGFGLLYAAYILAGDHWPPWLGRAVFELFERMGGAPALVTGLVVLAAVPAAFQYGLWDSTVQDRCRRLELLLLTELDGTDYWHASMSAAWKRGRGYMIVAFLLWGALLLSGRCSPAQVSASVAAGVLLWGFSFVVGFAAFSGGAQANGLGSFLTLGLPLAAAGLLRVGGPSAMALVPPGAVFAGLTDQPAWHWLPGPLVTGLFTIWLARRITGRCESHLRRWYDLNQGARPATA